MQPVPHVVLIVSIVRVVVQVNERTRLQAVFDRLVITYICMF